MPFNGTGTWTPPAGQPVSSGTVISASVFNTLVTDIGQTFNNTLPRDGQATLTAPLKLTDGTVSSPALTFNSETSTGLWRPGANLLAISVTGVEAVRFKNNGNVMIGQTSDSGQRLQITGDTLMTGNLSVTGTITGHASQDLKLDGSTTMSGPLVTTSSNAEFFLNDVSTMQFMNTANTVRTGYIQATTGSSLTHATENGADQRWLVGGTERMRIDTAGNVGIGLVSNSTKLQVGGSISTLVYGAQDTFLSANVNGVIAAAVGANNSASTNSFGAPTGTAYVGSAGPGIPLVLTTNAIERLRISSTGNLTFNTTSAVESFNVNGGMNITGSYNTANLGSGGSLRLGGGAMAWVYPPGGADAKVWDVYSSVNVLNWRLVNDANNAAVSWMTVNRSGMTVTGIGFGGPVGGTSFNGYLATGNVSQFTNDSGYLTSASSIPGTSLTGTTLAAGITTSSINRVAAGVTDSNGIELGYKGIPVNATWAPGQCFVATSGQTITTAVAGQAYSIFNNSATAFTLTQGSGLTLHQGGTTNTGNRTLLPWGFATIWFATSAVAVINGNIT